MITDIIILLSGQLLLAQQLHHMIVILQVVYLAIPDPQNRRITMKYKLERIT